MLQLLLAIGTVAGFFSVLELALPVNPVERQIRYPDSSTLRAELLAPRFHRPARIRGSAFFHALLYQCMSLSDHLLKFGHGNAKLPNTTMTFALPAGHTCPGALHCLAKADPVTGKIQDGPHTLFRCSAASEETRPFVRAARWHNFRLLAGLNTAGMVELIDLSLRAQVRTYTERVRWFTSGDCWSQPCRDALIEISRRHPELLFYLYSKNLPLWLEHGHPLPLPGNLLLTASWGGRYDFLLQDGLFPRTARVVNTYEDAAALGLAIDFDDRLAYASRPTHFAHLVHGTQPRGSAAGFAISDRRKRGLFAGYSDGKHHLPPLPTAP